MAASFANPKITNKILDDVPAIQELLGYLAQANPSLGGDFPTNSIRIVASGSGYQIQKYNGSAWASVGQLQHDVTSLAGYSVSTSAVAGKIPVYNSSAQLVGSITGNAASATKLATARNIQVGGIASSTAQSFNGTANVTIPINQITINNSADTAVNGVLTIVHGGTGRTDGAAQDVVISSIKGTILAKSVGQLGDPVNLGQVDVDTVTATGDYTIESYTDYQKRHLPQRMSDTTPLRVKRFNNYIYQYLEYVGISWTRRSTDSGASWTGWRLQSANFTSNVVIYVSKSGNDNNSGLDSSYPVLTIDRALQIAAACKLANGGGQLFVGIRLGEGNWGNIRISHFPHWIWFSPYDGAIPTAYSASLPVLNQLIVDYSCVIIRGSVIGYLNSNFSAYIRVEQGYKRIGRINASGGWIAFDSQDAATNLLELAGLNTAQCFEVYDFGHIYMDFLHIKLGENRTVANFLFVDRGGFFRCRTGRTVLDSSSYTLTGKKFTINSGARFFSLQPGNYVNTVPAWLNSLPGTIAGVAMQGAQFEGCPYGYGIDGNYVHKAGAETITGLKTIAIEGRALVFKHAGMQYNAAPSANKSSYLEIEDKDGVWIAQWVHSRFANGTNQTWFNVKNNSGGSASASMNAYADGTFALTFPTPPTNSNSTQGATSAWVRAVCALLAGNQTIAGTKTFSSSPLVPTVATTDSSTKTASTAFVKSLFGRLLNGMVPNNLTRVNLKINTSYTASYNGYVSYYGANNPPTVSVLLNGSTISYTVIAANTIFFPVKTGDTFTLSIPSLSTTNPGGSVYFVTYAA